MNSKIFLVACGLFATGVALAGECPASLDWDSAQTVARGIKCINFKVDQPRLMENYIVRVDLREPGLRITGTHRAKEWGEPMPDYTNMVMAIDTRRQKTQDFLEEHRRNGTRDEHGVRGEHVRLGSVDKALHAQIRRGCEVPRFRRRGRLARAAARPDAGDLYQQRRRDHEPAGRRSRPLRCHCASRSRTKRHHEERRADAGLHQHGHGDRHAPPEDTGLPRGAPQERDAPTAPTWRTSSP